MLSAFFFFLSSLLLLLQLVCSSHLRRDSSRSLRLLQSSQQQQQQPQPLCFQCVKIDTVVHVLEDDWTDEYVLDLLQQLNLDFEATPFQFVLSKIQKDSWLFLNRTATRSDWQGPNPIAEEISGALRVGGPQVANLFLTKLVCSIGGGMASIAFDWGMFPYGVYSKRDYIFYCPTTRLRGVLTHEFGHWLGLQHIFATSTSTSNTRNNTSVCEGPGDGVDDTPVKSVASGLCGVNPMDPCSPGIDVSHNFMDYSNCMQEFTPGQIQKMYSAYNRYRQRLVECHETVVEVRVETSANFSLQDTNLQLQYIEWGLEQGYSISLLPRPDEDVDLRNQVLTKQLCLPIQSVVEFSIQNPDVNAKVSIQMNGRPLTPKRLPDSSKTSSDTQVQSAWLASSGVCNDDSEARFSLDLALDYWPSDISWNLKQRDGPVLIDSAVTYTHGTTHYVGNLAASILYYDACLTQGDYVFAIQSSTGMGLSSPGYYQLVVNQEQVYFGGRNDFTRSREIPFTVTTRIPVQAAALAACFSGSSRVQLQDGTTQPLEQLVLGTRVHVGHGRYEPVYSFGHYQRTIITDSKPQLLQIETASSRRLQVSPHHLMFVWDHDNKNHKQTIPAGTVKVGDWLVSGSNQPDEVLAITVMTASRGWYAPFTPSGTIVVDGVLASCYVTLEPYTAQLAGLDIHWLSHAFEFPHRLVCHYYKTCIDERYTKEGLSTWVSLPHEIATRWLLTSPRGVIWHGLLAVLVGVLVVFSVLEWCILHPGMMTILLVVMALLLSRVHGNTALTRRRCLLGELLV